MTMATYPSNDNGTKHSLNRLPYDDYTCLKIRSGSLFETVLLHGTIIIVYELVTQLKEQEPFIEQNKELRQPLKNILGEACNLLAVRSYVAENNIKGHLLFSAALGQIEAIEAGTSPVQGAIDGAEKSAQICLTLLAEKASVLTSDSENIMGDEISFDVQDWNMDCGMPDSWLFSSWDGGQVVDWSQNIC